MRILYLSHCGTQADLYGSETCFLHLTQVADDSGEIDTFAVVPPGGGLAAALEMRRIPHQTCPVLPFEFTPLRRTVDFLHSTYSLRKMMHQFEPDIIHANELAANQVAIAATLGTSIPVICHVRMIYSPTSFRWCLGHRAAEIVCMSKGARRALGEKGAQCTWVIPDPLRVPELDCKRLRDQFRRKWQIPADAFVCTVVASINSRKGQDIFLKALEALLAEDTGFFGLLVGGGFDAKRSPWHERLRELAHTEPLEGRVLFTGYIEDPWNAYCASDVVVLPSRSEGWGRTLPEAMAVERAVIGSNTGGIPDIITDEETGLLFEVGNHRQLARQLKRLRSNEALRKRLAAAGHAWVKKNCTPERHLSQLLNVYQRALSGAGGN